MIERKSQERRKWQQALRAWKPKYVDSRLEIFSSRSPQDKKQIEGVAWMSKAMEQDGANIYFFRVPQGRKLEIPFAEGDVFFIIPEKPGVIKRILDITPSSTRWLIQKDPEIVSSDQSIVFENEKKGFLYGVLATPRTFTTIELEAILKAANPELPLSTT